MLASHAAAGTSKPASCAHDLGHAARAFEPVLGVDVLPAGQEAQELRGGDGLDLLAQPVERVAVDAGEQAAVAPGLAAVDARAQDDTLGLERRRTASSRARVVAEDRPSASSRPRSTAFGSRVASAANQRSPSRTTRPAAASSSSHACQARPSSAVT